MPLDKNHIYIHFNKHTLKYSIYHKHNHLAKNNCSYIYTNTYTRKQTHMCTNQCTNNDNGVHFNREGVGEGRVLGLITWVVGSVVKV